MLGVQPLEVHITSIEWWGKLLLEPRLHFARDRIACQAISDSFLLAANEGRLHAARIYTKVDRHNFPGNDIADKDVKSMQECKAWCDSTATCGVFTMNKGNRCWLKSAAMHPTRDTEYTSWVSSSEGARLAQFLRMVGTISVWC